MTNKLKNFAKKLVLYVHPAAPVLNTFLSPNKEPFLCVITPVFDGALDSVKLLVHDLQQQRFKNFLVVFISNGRSKNIKKFVHELTQKDSRFVYDEINKEAARNHKELLINLGKRRSYVLKKYTAQRYVFLDADLKILDKDYFAKIYVADVLTRKHVICTQVQAPELKTPILPVFPIYLGRIDMANFTFSHYAAKNIEYPTDIDPTYGIANDYRFFMRLNTLQSTLFLDFVSAEKNGNNTYISVSDLADRKTPALISVFGNTFDEQETHAVTNVLKSHLVGRGKITEEFEKKFTEKIGFKYGAAVHSCTNAFWLLFQSLQFKKNAEVIIPNTHFYGVRNVLELLKIKYVISDVDPIVPNVSLKYLKPLITPKTQAIIFLEFGGYPVDILPIKKYLKKINREDILLILDAANSPFTMKNSKYTAQQYDYALYSFDMNKILVTGDGGMILSQNQKIIDEARSLSMWGISAQAKTGFERSQHSATWWELQIDKPGANMEMNNISAAIGLTQLPKIESFLKRRQEVDEYYREKLQHLVKKKRFVIPPRLPDVANNLYLFWIVLPSEKNRNALAKYLLENGIFSTVRYQPLVEKAKTPNAHTFYKTSLCLPFHQNLDSRDLKHITTHLEEFFSEYEK